MRQKTQTRDLTFLPSFVIEFGIEEEKYGHQMGSGSHNIGEQKEDQTVNPSLSPVLQEAEWRALRRDQEWIDRSQRHRYKRRHKQHNRKHAH